MLTVTDLFCGAGGSSSGAEAVAGVRVRMAANHWRLAIETHNTNLPHVDHDVADVAEVDPARYPTTDLLWASPSCTFWSQARGQKRDFTPAATEPSLFDLVELDDLADELGPLPDEAKDRSRALMHDVPRFAEHHRYRAVIVENVPDVLHWHYLPKWLARMRALGYDHELLTLNSAFACQLGAPAPQLRDRVYVVFWQHRYRRPDFERWVLRPPAWCPTCGEVVTAIRAPKRPDRPHGAYGRQYVFRCPSRACRHTEALPYVLPAAAAIDWATPGQRIGDRRRPLAPKTMARIEAGLRRYARPIALEAAGHTYERRPGVRTWPVDEPLRTLHTTASKALACPPLLTVLRTHGGTTPITEPMRTVVAGTVAHALLVPTEGRDGLAAHPAARPMRVQTARQETGLLVPAGGTWNTTATSTDQPMRTRTTRDTEALVIPLRGTNRPKPADAEPLDTVTAAGNHHALLMRNNSGGAEMCTPADEPLRTLTTAGHQSLIMRNFTARGDHGQMSTPAAEPLRTLTANGKQSLLTWAPDLLYAYDTGRLRRTTEPLTTQTTVTGDALIEAGISVEDCQFRMLMPVEIKLGMGFVVGFVLLGNQRDQVALCGGAVPPPSARDLIAALVEAITGEAVSAA